MEHALDGEGIGPVRFDRASIWNAFSLQPHRSETFKLSTDPQFVEKVRDIVGLYLDPPERALVLCVDEKSQIQALDRTQPLLPMRPGQAERRTHDYERHGVTTLFAALDVKAGTIVGKCMPRHRAREFRKFLDEVERNVLANLDIHVVMDNASSHKTKLIRAWFAKRRRWHVHFTPTSSSWINQVERFFALLSEQQIKRGVHRSTAELEAAINTYIKTRNADPKPFRWTKSADDILASIERFCRRTISAHETELHRNFRIRTLGPFWDSTSGYAAAWRQLQVQLAAKYDTNPLVQEVAVTSCTSYTAEPFYLPNDTTTVVQPLLDGGYSDAAYQQCLENAVADYAPWQTTRLEFTFNPFTGLTLPESDVADVAFSERVMRACRVTLGQRCILSNHDLDTTPPSAGTILPLYALERKLGPNITFQTYVVAPADYEGTLRKGISLGAGSIEIWQEPKGFEAQSIATLQNWASMFVPQ